MTSEWTPWGMDDDEIEDYNVLVPGVPPWMRETLIGWILEQWTNDGYASVSRLLPAQSVTRIDLGVEAGSFIVPDLGSRLRRLSGNDLLRLADYIAAGAGKFGTALSDLEKVVLAASRSKWKVGERHGKPGIVERLPEGVQDAVEGAIEDSPSAGRVLARAWAHVHGLDPNDSAAYGDAVRAVEIAASVVVASEDTTATLGKRLGQMKADGDWRLDLREHRDAPGPEMLLMMIRTLWFGHRDRHGSADYTDVTHAEALQAVYLAATLVAWFDAGAIQRRTR